MRSFVTAPPGATSLALRMGAVWLALVAAGCCGTARSPAELQRLKEAEQARRARLPSDGRSFDARWRVLRVEARQASGVTTAIAHLEQQPTLSIGLAERSKAMNLLSMAQILSAADAALYDAKAGPRNCIKTYCPPQAAA